MITVYVMPAANPQEQNACYLLLLCGTLENEERLGVDEENLSQTLRRARSPSPVLALGYA